MRNHKPNVLFICVDCLRSDFACGDYGTSKPLFEYFENNGTLLDTMIASASTTTPAVASCMTGTYSHQHGIYSLVDFVLNDHVPTLAEIFYRNGYQTLAHVTGPLLKNTNLDRGFNQYKYRCKNKTVYTNWWQDFKSDIETLEQPWFMYLHLWEPHEPRYPPPDVSHGELTYDACIRGVAKKVEEILSVIDLSSTIVAITGDHGESVNDGTLRHSTILKIHREIHEDRIIYFLFDTKFGKWTLPIPEKILGVDYVSDFLEDIFKGKIINVDAIYPTLYIFNNYLRDLGIEFEDFYNDLRKLRKAGFPSSLHKIGHGYQIYDFLVRVPFGICGPGIDNKGRINHQSRQIDIFPTLLSAAGLEYPNVDGEDILKKNFKEKPAFSKACGIVLQTEKNWLYGIRYDNWKFIKGKSRSLKQLFNLSEDPIEINNVVYDFPEVVKELEKSLDNFIWIEESGDDSSIPETEEIKMEQHLRELGYL